MARRSEDIDFNVLRPTSGWGAPHFEFMWRVPDKGTASTYNYLRLSLATVRVEIKTKLNEEHRDVQLPRAD